MKNNIFPLMLCFSLLFVFSCSSDNDDDITPIPDPTPTNITYTNTIKSIVTTNCATAACHDSTAPAAGLSLTTFTNLKGAFQTKGALSLIESGAMPKDKPKLPAATITKINSWVTGNYPE